LANIDTLQRLSKGEQQKLSKLLPFQNSVKTTFAVLQGARTQGKIKIAKESANVRRYSNVFDQ